MNVSKIWDAEMQYNREFFRQLENGSTVDEARKDYYAKIAKLATPEEYTVSELAKCDIYVDAAKIIYSVQAAFPAVKGEQIARWICNNAEEHHDITVPRAWANADGTINFPK